MKNVILLGAGQAHIELLARLAAKPLAGVQVSLVTPYPHQFYPGRLAGFVAGQHSLEGCIVALDPLLKKAGARWLGKRVAALQVEERTIKLDGGSTFGYDWLSIDTGITQDRRQIEALLPGAREHGLFVHPLEAFCELWPRVAALATSRPLRIAILGATQAGLELAMAIRERLRGSSVTLIYSGTKIAADHPTAHQATVVNALKHRNVTLLSDVAVEIQADQVLLGSGARLACDVPVIAFVTQTPTWLGSSGLTLDQHGSVALDPMQRSVSHPHAFAAVDSNLRANQALSKNLLALLAGSPAHHVRPVASSLKFLSLGDRRALLSWGGLSAQGRWVGWLKDWFDQRYIRRYRSD